jgi:dCMP deaminase
MNEIWQQRFLDLAHNVATWSKDPSTKVGAVIVDADKHILSVGFNGFPKGFLDLPERYDNKAFKYAHVLHAEHNAILHCAHDPRGSTIFVTHQPCTNCATILVSKGIQRVVWKQQENYPLNKWGDSIAVFDECGVQYSYF